MDVPGIGQNRYQTFEELYLYCYRYHTTHLSPLPIPSLRHGPHLPIPSPSVMTWRCSPGVAGGRVAGTVGLMTLPIMGTAPGYTLKQATEPALALGIALQVSE